MRGRRQEVESYDDHEMVVTPYGIYPVRETQLHEEERDSGRMVTGGCNGLGEQMLRSGLNS